MPADESGSPAATRSSTCARRGACGVVYFRLETTSLEHDDVVMVMDGIFSERVMSNLSFDLHLMV